MATFQTHHQGNIIELAIKKSKYSIVDIARELGVNRRTVYNYLNKEVVPQDQLEKFEKVLDVDFSVEYPSVFTKYDKIPGSFSKPTQDSGQPQQVEQPIESIGGDIRDRLIASLERERLQMFAENLNLKEEIFELKQKLAAYENAK